MSVKLVIFLGISYTMSGVLKLRLVANIFMRDRVRLRQNERLLRNGGYADVLKNNPLDSSKWIAINETPVE